MNRTVREVGEDWLLAHVAKLLEAKGRSPARLLLGLGDDAAVTAPGTKRMVWTVDSMVEGSHFRFWPEAGPPDWLGWKLVASNMSDLAAMGASPAFALLSLGVPGDAKLTDIEAFYRGLNECLEHYGGALIGGDTVRAPQWTLSLMLVGELDDNVSIASRNRARPGHGIYVTGALGESAAGLALLEGNANPVDLPEHHRQRLVRRHLRPTPRLDLGLVEQIPDICMMDLSDGLARDGARMAKLSEVRLVIEDDQLELSPWMDGVAASAGKTAQDFVLHGGEDYVLLFTGNIPAGVATMIRDVSRVNLTRIGTVRKGKPGLFLFTRAGEEVEITPKGFEHFA